MIPRGLPEPLPPGETLLWTGSPDWRVLASCAMHVRVLAVYFAGLALWGASLHADEGVASTARILLRDAALGAVPIALAVVYAYASARAAVYTITDKRVVLRIGLALQVNFNLPFAEIGSADVRLATDGTGDVFLALAGKRRIPYLVLWPHARPWRFLGARPAMRGLRDVSVPANILACALAAASDMPVRSLSTARPSPAPTGAEALA